MCTRWFINSDREIRPPADSSVVCAFPGYCRWILVLPAAICHLNGGHMRKYGTCPFHALGGVFCLVFLRIFPHVCFAVRFYAHRHRPDGDAAQQSRTRTMEPRRGPGAGWGSSLCCWVVILPPCGDDCAIYCLAGAGEQRRWNGTGPSVRFEEQ